MPLTCETDEMVNCLDGRARLEAIPYRAHVAVRLGEAIRDLTLSKNGFRSYDEEALMKNIKTNLDNTDMLDTVRVIVKDEIDMLCELKDEYTSIYMKKVGAKKNYQKVLEGWYEGKLAGLEEALKRMGLNGNDFMELRDDADTLLRRIGTEEENK